TAQASVSIGGPDFELPPVHLRDSECRSGIRCSTSLDVAFENLALGAVSVDGVAAGSAAVEFAGGEDRWEASAADTRLTLKRPAIGGRRVIAPAVHADLAAADGRLSAAVRFGTPDGGLAGTATLSHDLESGRGELTLDAATIDFATLPLAGLFIDWPYDWNVEAGTAAADADVSWQETDTGFAVSGTLAATAGDLAGRYAEIGFVGFSTRIDAAIGPQATVTLQPARFDVALVDVGFPVEDISGIATPDIEESAFAVSGLSMSLLGGTVTADPFRFDLDADGNQLTLRASGIQLPLMAALADLEAVTISGSVSGQIPVTIRGNKVIIDGGHLENDPPGGVIRYGGAAAGNVVDDGSQLGVVTRTLRNFEFDSLSSAVEYAENGDLVLQMRLEGINPDFDPTQPVILNLNVQNNVPQMLRSLQATRSIGEVLEQRLSK
ncbi:MAG TPA: YdbH domain-containing protein, partial [Woeseiaceae bacterium]|nr:YdbH domain-containing protein [Woeseiaceae bacterium]